MRNEFSDTDPYGDFMEDDGGLHHDGNYHVGLGTVTVLDETQCPIYPDCQGQGCDPKRCRYVNDLARDISNGATAFYDAATNRVVVEDPSDPTEEPPKDERTWAQRRLGGLDIED
jgi:hypothetical protein